MNVAELLALRLSELGVRRVWGEALLDGPSTGDSETGGATLHLEHIAVPEADLALLLADADGRVGEVDGRGRLGAALLPGQILHLSSEPAGRAALRSVGTPQEMLDALVDPPGLLSPGTSAMQLDMDLADTVPEDLVASVEPERQPVVTLDPSMADLRLVVLAGPGVVRAGAVAALGDMCTRSGAGVFNTWGAKGVLRWDSPWHFGTIGLQQRDVELAELDGFDIVITTGLDPAELPQDALSRLVVQDVHPAQLRALCGSWSAKNDPPGERPRLYPEIAAALRPLYEDDSAPLSPARAALHLSGALPDAAMAVADSGQAGFWVARAFPTSIPNSVCVPARRAPGFAASAALVCQLEGRGVLAVTDEEGFDAPETGAVLAFAEDVGAPVALQVWRDSGPSWESSADHVNLIEAELAAEKVRVDDVAVRFAALEVLEAVAGGVSAWTDH